MAALEGLGQLKEDVDALKESVTELNFMLATAPTPPPPTLAPTTTPPVPPTTVAQP